MKSKSFAGELPHVTPLNLTFSQEDIDDILMGDGSTHLLFGQISARQILQDLGERGLEDRLLKRGYLDLQAEIEKHGPFEESLRITARHQRHPDRRYCLMDLRAHWGMLDIPTLGQRKALVWDWVELADPVAEFPPHHPPLPGQTSPGLALFRPLGDQMQAYVARTEAQALVSVPQYYHNAVLYCRDDGLRFRFLNPVRRGQLTALLRDLHEVDLAEASWAFEEDRVETRAPGSDRWELYLWQPAELVLGLCEDVKASFRIDDPGVAEGEAYYFRIRPR